LLRKNVTVTKKKTPLLVRY